MPTTSTLDTRLRTLTDDLTDSERYRLLADERRRLILTILHERGRPMDLDDLAAALATAEQEAAARRIRITLHHKQLPMMAELGVLAYDTESGRVQLSR